MARTGLMTQQERLAELQRQMAISLRAGRIEEYMQLQAQLHTMLFKQAAPVPFTKS